MTQQPNKGDAFLRRRLFVRIARIIGVKNNVFVITGQRPRKAGIGLDNSKKRGGALATGRKDGW